MYYLNYLNLFVNDLFHYNIILSKIWNVSYIMYISKI